jgi:hypothetical protein
MIPGFTAEASMKGVKGKHKNMGRSPGIGVAINILLLSGQTDNRSRCMDQCIYNDDGDWEFCDWACSYEDL